MATKRKVVDAGVQDSLLALGSVLNDEVPDWSAVDSFPLGKLVSCLGAVDGAVMIRSSERGAARSIGAFVGGVSQWTTCRDQRELLAMLEAIHKTLEDLIGKSTAPAPSGAAQRPRKASPRA